uniref:Uncharacterized protein n=1 Tax=mine drainage metagenome TaxID=410659 RepID=E6QUR0_9ZZZZ
MNIHIKTTTYLYLSKEPDHIRPVGAGDNVVHDAGLTTSHKYYHASLTPRLRNENNLG